MEKTGQGVSRSTLDYGPRPTPAPEIRTGDSNGRTATVDAPRFRPADLTLLVTLSLAWGSSYVFIRQGLVLGASPLAFAAIRFGLSAAVFAVLAAVRGEPFPSRHALVASASVGGMLILGITGGLLFWGEQYTTAGYAAVLSATIPFLTVAIGYSLLKSERLGGAGLVGIAVGFAGTTLLVIPELFGSPIGTGLGPLFVLGSAVSVATGTVALRSLRLGPQGLWQIGSQFAVAAALLGVATAIVPTREAFPATLALLSTLAALVVFTSVVGYLIYFALHNRLGPIRANLVTYLSPLVGLGIGTGLLGEPVTAFELGGLAVVLAGVTLVVRESK